MSETTTAETKESNTLVLIVDRDTYATYGKGLSQLEGLRNHYAAKLNEAGKKRTVFFPDLKTIEECKLQGEFLEELVVRFLQEKGHSPLPHNVEDRYEPDITVEHIPTGTLEVEDDWVIEVSNTSAGTFYPRKRLKTHLKNLRTCMRRGYNTYWVVSHREALKNVEKDLDEIGVRVLEIGSVVLPDNLDETFDMLREAIDSAIPNASPKERRQNR